MLAPRGIWTADSLIPQRSDVKLGSLLSFGPKRWALRELPKTDRMEVVSMLIFGVTPPRPTKSWAETRGMSPPPMPLWPVVIVGPIGLGCFRGGTWKGQELCMGSRGWDHRPVSSRRPSSPPAQRAQLCPVLAQGAVSVHTGAAL